MTVAAVIPARNAADTILRAIRSAEAQSPRPRILVIDDGSEDATGDLARQAGAEVLRCDGRGPAAARNVGLRACTEPYAAFLDADDEWLPGHLARVDALARRSAPALVAASAVRIDGSGKVVGTTRARLDRGDDPLVALLEGRLKITTSAAAVDVRSALAAGAFDEQIELPSCEDWDLWVRLAARGPVAVIDQAGVRYQVNDSPRAALRIDQVARDREASLRRFLLTHPARPGVVRRARAWMHLDLATGFLKADRHDEARRHLYRTLRLQPWRPRAWALLLLAAAPAAGHRLARTLKRSLAPARWR